MTMVGKARMNSSSYISKNRHDFTARSHPKLSLLTNNWSNCCQTRSTESRILQTFEFFTVYRRRELPLLSQSTFHSCKTLHRLTMQATSIRPILEFASLSIVMNRTLPSFSKKKIRRTDMMFIATRLSSTSTRPLVNTTSTTMISPRMDPLEKYAWIFRLGNHLTRKTKNIGIRYPTTERGRF